MHLPSNFRPEWTSVRVLCPFILRTLKWIVKIDRLRTLGILRGRPCLRSFFFLEWIFSSIPSLFFHFINLAEDILFLQFNEKKKHLETNSSYNNRLNIDCGWELTKLFYNFIYLYFNLISEQFFFFLMN